MCVSQQSVQRMARTKKVHENVFNLYLFAKGFSI
jgi:hypothetical protein